MMMGRLGGKRGPNVPELVTSPRENFSGYFPCNNAGRRIPPKAMMVRPVAPVRAVKAEQVIRAMIDKPPGNQPNKALVNPINLLGALLSERRYPAKVKRGMATRMGVVAIRCISMIMAEESILARNKRKRVRPEKTVKRGAPRNMIRKAMRIKRRIMSLSLGREWGASFASQKDS
jgi:hypothetical protein